MSDINLVEETASLIRERLCADIDLYIFRGNLENLFEEMIQVVEDLQSRYSVYKGEIRDLYTTMQFIKSKGLTEELEEFVCKVHKNLRSKPLGTSIPIYEDIKPILSEKEETSGAICNDMDNDDEERK